MPFALTFIGLLLVITGFQNTYSELGSQVGKDFTSEEGKPSFIYWIIALGVVGILGYNDTLKPFSRAFMALIIVGIFLADGQGQGFFARILSDVEAGSKTKPLPAGGNDPVLSQGGSGGSSGGGGSANDIGSAISTAVTIASFL